MSDEHTIERLDVAVYTIPTDAPEADGTLAWDSTSLVIVEPRTQGGTTGLGYAFGNTATGILVRDVLADVVVGRDIRDTAGAWEAMVRSIRNLGRSGISSMAIAAVDIALWDTKARCADQPLFRLLGAIRDEIPIYGSGGFTAYTEARLAKQLADWVEQGIPRVKMKIGTDRGARPATDLSRVTAARRAIGPHAELYVDANGAYGRAQARELGLRLAHDLDVTWFEEPVSSDDLTGLAQLRETLPLEVTAGEYGYDLDYFKRMLDTRAVDVLQADVTRCAGITEWLRVAALAAANHTPLSAHCGPSLHAHIACVAPTMRHIEYFHDHTRIDRLIFDGTLLPDNGHLRPATDRPGLGLTLRRADAQPYRAL
jgi:L-alanine-DL-glutamate epimerase-like enolase superfamily enzyme